MQLVERGEGRSGGRDATRHVRDIREGRHGPAVDHMRPGRNQWTRRRDRGAGARESADQRDLAFEIRKGIAPDPAREGRDPNDNRRRREVDQEVAAVLQDLRRADRQPVSRAERDGGGGGGRVGHPAVRRQAGATVIPSSSSDSWSSLGSR